MEALEFHEPRQRTSARVALALDIHRSIAACNDYLARSNDVHALTAALMLPCYRAELQRLQLDRAEERELASALGQIAGFDPA
ncbi:hypothetical protein AB4Z46_02695 [Variovorax sp. M-6]|uniref:hypothetical protein n=1 Tax=Variovorax sp. M-6 TaxID=3233041 RepID=UPI003F9E933B